MHTDGSDATSAATSGSGTSPPVASTSDPPSPPTSGTVAGADSSGEVGTGEVDTSTGTAAPGEGCDPATLDGWRVETPLPMPRESLATVVVGTSVFAIGGWSGAAVTPDVFAATAGRDGSLGEWTPAAALPEPREHHAAAALGGRVIVAGGNDATGEPRADVFVAQVEDGVLSPWASGVSLPEPRLFGGHGTDGTSLYIVGGRTPQPTASVVRGSFDGDQIVWTPETSLPMPRVAPAVVVHDSQIFVLGGDAPSTDRVVVADLAADGTVGMWTVDAPLVTPRAYLSAFAFEDQLVVAGGADENLVGLTAVEGRQPGTAAWQPYPELTAPRFAYGSFRVDNRMYAVGGWSTLGQSLEASIVSLALCTP